jgi:hypothetical protein
MLILLLIGYKCWLVTLAGSAPSFCFLQYTCRDAVACLLCNNVVDWNLFKALLVSQLIALDKNPAIHPIGIGVARDLPCHMWWCSRNLWKWSVVCSVVLREKYDLLMSCLILLVDTKNAFNTINRSSLLWNLCPTASRFFFNTYRRSSSIIIKGSSETISRLA